MATSSQPASTPASVGSPIPCPTWCTLPAGHGADDLPDDGRIHYVPSPKSVHVSFDDGAVAVERGGAWYAEVIGTDHQHDTREALAADLRATAADLIAVAEWLEGQS